MANYGLSVLDGDLKYTAPDGTVVDIAETTGSGAVIVVNVTPGEDSDPATADMTSAEIIAALNAGNMVIASVPDGDLGEIIMKPFAYDSGFVDFTASYIDDSSYLCYFYVSFSNDGSVDTVDLHEKVMYDLSTLIVT